MKKVVSNLSAIQGATSHIPDEIASIAKRYITDDPGSTLYTLVVQYMRETNKAVDEMKQALREIVAHIETN